MWYANAKPDAAQGLIYDEATGKNIAVAYDPKDAPLIAAAPKMLAALEEVETNLRDWRADKLRAYGLDFILEQARAAIEAGRAA